MSIVILKPILDYLSFSGIWPNRHEELNPSSWFYPKFIFLMILASPLLIGNILHMIILLKSKEGYVLQDDFMMASAQIGVIYFLVQYASEHRKLAVLYLRLSDFEKFGEPPEFAKKNAFLNKLGSIFKRYIDCAYTGVVLFSLTGIPECRRLNKQREFQDVCGLMSPAWFPFDFSHFPVKYMVFAIQVYAGYITFKGAGTISYVITATTEHVVIRIDHLKELLRQTVEMKDLKSQQDALRVCIQYHLDIFELGDLIDQIHAKGLFLHVSLTGLVFALNVYIFISTGKLNGISLFLGWGASFVIVCVGGERLYNASLSVGEDLYQTNWYNCTPSFQKQLLMIMVRSSRPICTHAGPISYLSNVIILTIFKTAYSYLTLLNATSK